MNQLVLGYIWRLSNYLGVTDFFFSRCETGDFKKYIGNSYVRNFINKQKKKNKQKICS